MICFESAEAAVGTVCPNAFLLGPRNRYYYMSTQGEIEMIGVRFRHGGFSPFTKIPVDAFMNQILSLRDIFGNVAENWLNKLYEAGQSQARITCIQNILSAQLQVSHDVHQALALISTVRKSESETIQEICNQTGVYYKKMERIFSKYTGYNPKNFSRVVRFYRSLQEMKHADTSLTSIGLYHGYYDQAHFIKDFKAFTGTSPSQFEWQGTTIANLLLSSNHV